MSKDRAMENAYHHGNLRQELLKAANHALEEVGFEHLSIRKLAQTAGVSPGAPYRHFETREDLLFSLALDGAAVLASAYERAAIEKSCPDDRLRAICSSYLDLARKSPQLFRLMFDSEIVVGVDPRAEWLQATQGAFLVFEGAIASVAPSLSKADLRHRTAFVWATIHGLASMHIHGRLHRFKNQGDTIDQIVESTLDLVISSCKADRKR
jgi:AcrR family transcriptional regulator